ncbi:hypothetical protein LZ30DRAFT_248886 [Colletotrichum cereale]|nr:hypothetical protein LZ30DRAFT_248886 [Colletotrichum cereale]
MRQRFDSVTRSDWSTLTATATTLVSTDFSRILQTLSPNGRRHKRLNSFVWGNGSGRGKNRGQTGRGCDPCYQRNEGAGLHRQKYAACLPLRNLSSSVASHHPRRLIRLSRGSHLHHPCRLGEMEGIAQFSVDYAAAHLCLGSLVLNGNFPGCSSRENRLLQPQSGVDSQLSAVKILCRSSASCFRSEGTSRWLGSLELFKVPNMDSMSRANMRSTQQHQRPRTANSQALPNAYPATVFRVLGEMT